MNKITPILALLIGFAWTAPQAEASVITALTSVASGTTPNQPFTLGYRFTVNEAMSLTALGQFDVAGDGVDSSARVALFNWGTGDKLFETTLSGAALEETGHFDTYFVDIAPIALSVGVQYLVVTEVAAQDFVFGENIMNFDSSVQWIEGRATPSGSPAMPATANSSTFSIARSVEADGSYFGPNMKLAAIPEPGVLSLLGLGGMALLVCHRHLRSVSRHRQKGQ